MLKKFEPKLHQGLRFKKNTNLLGLDLNFGLGFGICLWSGYSLGYVSTIPKSKRPKFQLSGVKFKFELEILSPQKIGIMITEVFKDSIRFRLGLHNLYSMWMALGLKFSAFLNDWMGVKNTSVLYVINDGVVDDTGVVYLRHYLNRLSSKFQE